jgi:hypothetical protein
MLYPLPWSIFWILLAQLTIAGIVLSFVSYVVARNLAMGFAKYKAFVALYEHNARVTMNQAIRKKIEELIKDK